MKKLTCLYTALLLLGFTITLSAQDAGVDTALQNAGIDTSQIRIMRDSLDIDVLQATRICNLRTEFLKAAEDLRGTGTISKTEIDVTLDKMKKRLYKNIEVTIGKDKFNNYLNMIKSRNKIKNPMRKTLAG